MYQSFIRLIDKELCCGCEFRPAGRLFLCEDCLSSLPSIPTQLPSLHFVHQCWALLPYEGSGGALVRKVKFQPNLRLAGQLAERLGAAAESLPKPDAVVPIPSLPKRLRSRGFNFAEVLAKQMAFNLKVPCLSSVLRRTDDGQQSGRSDRSRRSGLSGRFLLQAKELPRHVMLVDDVLTTGGTLDGAAISLLGVCQRVSGVVVASRQI